MRDRTICDRIGLAPGSEVELLDRTDRRKSLTVGTIHTIGGP
jgi:hypothetical protein